MHQDDLPPGEPAPSGQPGRILVVAGEAELGGELVASLRAAGYAVDVAQSGREALRCAEQTRYSRIILSLMLPDIAGILVYLMLRGIDPELSQRTIFVSGSQREAASHPDLGGLGLGCLSHPFALDDLIRGLDTR